MSYNPYKPVRTSTPWKPIVDLVGRWVDDEFVLRSAENGEVYPPSPVVQKEAASEPQAASSNPKAPEKKSRRARTRARKPKAEPSRKSKRQRDREPSNEGIPIADPPSKRRKQTVPAPSLTRKPKPSTKPTQKPTQPPPPRHPPAPASQPTPAITPLQRRIQPPRSSKHLHIPPTIYRSRSPNWTHFRHINWTSEASRDAIIDPIIKQDPGSPRWSVRTTSSSSSVEFLRTEEVIVVVGGEADVGIDVRSEGDGLEFLDENGYGDEVVW